MSIQEWAKREIEIACEREKEGCEDGSCSYGIGCYNSALKAFESLCDDGHSGMSISITKNILNRLIDGQPLTPITDDEDEWEDVTTRFGYDTDGSGRQLFQAKRQTSLFKNIKDGQVRYNDIRRYYAYRIGEPDITFTNGFVEKVLDQTFPITLPYYPSNNRYAVATSDYLTDEENGDWDTLAIWFIKDLDGNKVEVNRYFTEKGGELVEIDAFEFEECRRLHEKRISILNRKMAQDDAEKIRGIGFKDDNGNITIDKVIEVINSNISNEKERDMFEHFGSCKEVLVDAHEMYIDGLNFDLSFCKDILEKIDGWEERCKISEYLKRTFYIVRTIRELYGKPNK